MPPQEAAEALFRPLKISSRQVSLLNALDQYRNMRRAAIAMNTTQPTASLLLRQLEERLSVKLFERLPRGMEPTIYGEVLIRYAKGASHDFEHAEAEIAELSKGAKGLVRIGSVVGTVPSLLTSRLIGFKTNHPRVRMSIDVGTSDTLLPHLIDGDLDVVIGRRPDQHEHVDLAIDLLADPEQMSVISRPGHQLARKKKIPLADLFEQTWILHPVGSPMRLRVENALRQAKMASPLDIVETSSLLAVTALIEASEMISVVPRDVALHYAKYGMVAVLDVAMPLSMVNLGIITKRNRALSPAVMEFIKYLKAP